MTLPLIDPRDFGATFAGGNSDDTSALQLAINAALSGDTLLLPPGIANLTGTLYVNGGVKIVGCGARTHLHPQNPNQVCILINTNESVIFRDFLIAGQASNQTGISINPLPPDENANSIFEGLQINNVSMGINANNAKHASFHNITMSLNTDIDAIGFHFDNMVSPDHGDSSVNQCYISGTASARNSRGIYQTGQGGLRVTSTKIIGFGNGYEMNLRGNTVDLFFSSCSIEQIAKNGMLFNRQDDNLHFNNVLVTGCQFGAPLKPNTKTMKRGDKNEGWLNAVAVVGSRISPMGGLQLGSGLIISTGNC